MNTSTTIGVVEGSDALMALEPEWSRLASTAPSSYFQTPAWVQVWHEQLEPAARLILVCAREDGELVGLVPLAVMRRHVHSRVPVPLTFVGFAGAGSGSGDHLGPLLAPGADAAGLLHAAGRAAGRRSLLLESVTASHVPALERALRVRAIDRVRCPAITVPTGFDDIVDAFGKKLRKNIRRRGRLLDEAGVKGRWVESTAELVATLDDLQELHTRRWKAKGGAGLFDEGRHRLLAGLARRADARSGARLFVFEADGAVVAAMFCLLHKDTISIYKTGWDPDYKRFGLGIALATAALEWAHAHGLATVDYLRGAEPHKYELGGVDRVDTTLLRPRGVSGRVLAWREDMSRRRADAESGRGATGEDS